MSINGNSGIKLKIKLMFSKTCLELVHHSVYFNNFHMGVLVFFSCEQLHHLLCILHWIHWQHTQNLAAFSLLSVLSMLYFVSFLVWTPLNTQWEERHLLTWAQLLLCFHLAHIFYTAVQLNWWSTVIEFVNSYHIGDKLFICPSLSSIVLIQHLYV